MEIMLPRIFSGAISDKYNGAAYEAMPTARPRIIRATTNNSTLGVRSEHNEPTTNKRAPINRLYLRPSLADNQPAPIAPMAAPNIIELTTHSCWWGVM